MAEDSSSSLGDEQSYRLLVQGVDDLQASACDIGIERHSTQSIYDEECDKSVRDNNEEDTLKVIKQTTDIARLAMILLVRGLQAFATYASRRSKCFTSFSSAISFIRAQEGPDAAPQHLLLQWERNVVLIDLFISDERLYCNKRVAQDMFDICLETFDWLRSLANNNK